MKRLASLLLLAAACTESEAPTGDQVTSFVERREIPLSMNANLDVLFVIDNSPAMAAAQQKLAGDLRAMAANIAAPSSGFTPNLHVGVITTDASNLGRLRNNTFLSQQTRFAWQAENNFDGAIADAFAPLASVGTTGSASPHPLDLTLGALRPGVNAGFLREDAYLAIVILTANDDAGTIAPADAARMLKAAKRYPEEIVVTGAFGACDGGGITASAAPRLDAFFDQFPNRSSKTTLCAPDLSQITALFGQLYKTTLGLACIEHVADVNRIDARLVDPETDETILYRACSSDTDTHCYALDANWGCPNGALAVKPRPWSTPFPATATLEFETR